MLLRLGEGGSGGRGAADVTTFTKMSRANIYPGRFGGLESCSQLQQFQTIQETRAAPNPRSVRVCRRTRTRRSKHRHYCSLQTQEPLPRTPQDSRRDTIAPSQPGWSTSTLARRGVLTAGWTTPGGPGDSEIQLMSHERRMERKYHHLWLPR